MSTHITEIFDIKTDQYYTMKYQLAIDICGSVITNGDIDSCYIALQLREHLQEMFTKKQGFDKLSPLFIQYLLSFLQTYKLTCTTKEIELVQKLQKILE